MPEASEPPTVALELAGPERAILLALRASTVPVPEEGLVDLLALDLEQVRGCLQRLRSKHLAVSDEEHLERARVTSRGETALRLGVPERRVWEALRAAEHPLSPAELSNLGLSEEERSAAIGILRRRGLVAAGMPLSLARPSDPLPIFPEEDGLRSVESAGPAPLAPVVASLVRRGLIELDHVTHRKWSASEEGRRLPVSDSADSVGAISPALLLEGRWKTATFRAYDVRAPVPRWSGARPHPYLEWLREFEEILIGLGFSESRGPLVETEFWNSDALFMPQEHPARSIHDVLSVRGIAGHTPPEPLVARVAAAHEGRPMPGESEAISVGWQAPYDRALAARTVLRSQTTAVSARFLAGNPAPPFRMYSLDRNFRRDAVDATHHVEFNQCEGVLGEAGTSLRDLVGVFRALSEALGIRELKFRPSYFPFTEPSIEGYVRHPRLGWIEVFPGGMFRPEVLRPLGIDVPVAAWGIGVTRLAMVRLGVSDIRELYSDDLGRLRRGPR
ncbi:MAG: phenylalanine--tRNA ligase subunit alpha [Thermoplasmata archaeon]|nr:phenylalanine--tRNA ligase subunit alpha [Thermoplasmata archaeon]MCI4359145.1 phenylalanine--tRNA ligase subunit alpha [Thermoplasmata archaeon]